MFFREISKFIYKQIQLKSGGRKSFILLILIGIWYFYDVSCRYGYY